MGYTIVRVVDLQDLFLLGVALSIGNPTSGIRLHLPKDKMTHEHAEYGIPDPKPKDNPKAAEIKKFSRGYLTSHQVSDLFSHHPADSNRCRRPELREFRGRQATLSSNPRRRTSERLQRRKLGKLIASINESLSRQLTRRRRVVIARGFRLPQAKAVLVATI